MTGLTTPSDDAVLWRYMDLGRLLSLVQTSSLFFSPIANFADPFEGSISRATLIAANDGQDPWGTRELSEDSTQWPKDDYDFALKTIQNARKIVLASCWHVNPDESAAMWDLYARGNKGVALCTTFSKLRESLSHYDDMHLGMVQYIDYDQFVMHDGNAFGIAFYKRPSFRHEQELRVVTGGGMGKLNGASKKISLSEFVREFVVAPGTPDWLFDSIQTLIHDKHPGLMVRRSSMSDLPPWGLDSLAPSG